MLTYAYDHANRVLDVNAKRGSTAIADYAYTRDTIGRVTTLTELGGRTVTYGYSQAGRLVNETIVSDPHGVNGTIAYTHDPVGNRLTRTSTVVPIPAQTFAYDANDRITTETYDQNGNTLTSDSDAFLYDFEDRLVAINSGVTLTYDAAGNLGARTEGGTKVAYLVDELSPVGYTQVVEEVTGGSVSKTYAYARVPVRSGNQSFIADGHTDVRLLSNASGAVTDEYDYEAFGVGTRTAGSGANPLRYTGERAESAGLTFLRARHVRNGNGRFLAADRLPGNPLIGGTMHRATYVDGEPVSGLDPSGYENLITQMCVTVIQTVNATLARASATASAAYISSFAAVTRTLERALASGALQKAAQNADKFKLSAKHLFGGGGDYAKFAQGANPHELLREALQSPNLRLYENFTKKGAFDTKAFQVVVDMTRVVGSKGEMFIRIIVDVEGHVVTWFPQATGAPGAPAGVL